MCGIFGYIGERVDTADMILTGLKRMEYRGYDSWGVAVVQNGKIFIKKKAGKIGQAVVSDLPESSFGFGHTRWATHGGVSDINSHPHLDCKGEVMVVHNGIIENYEGIKNDLISKGHKFISDTDTEVFAHLVEEYLQKHDLVPAVKKAFKKVTGLNAFIVIQANTEQMVAVRNGSPLVIGFGKKENLLASDPSALIPHTKKAYYLEDNEMAVVSATKVDIFDLKSGKSVSPKIIDLKMTVEETEKGKYSHFMLKEIHEQPKIITKIANDSLSKIQKISSIIKKSFGTHLIGCGTSSYACQAGSYIFSKIAERHINPCIGSEFNYQLDFISPKSLIIALSQSGETMDILEAVKKAKEKGAKIIALVNVYGSTLYREADRSILINAGVEKAVASTKAFTAKIAYLILLAYCLKGKVKEGRSVLKLAVKSSKKILSPKSVAQIKRIAKRISPKDHIYVVGRGLSFPAALETALKIKEVSYIHAEGLAAGELKHGVLALVEKGIPCIVFLPNDEAYEANLAGAMEMKARGGLIIGVSFKPHEIFDIFIPVSNAKEATIIPNVIVGQLLGYYLAIERDLDPDMPRNLAKSVTVK